MMVLYDAVRYRMRFKARKINRIFLIEYSRSEMRLEDKSYKYWLRREKEVLKCFALWFENQNYFSQILSVVTRKKLDVIGSAKTKTDLISNFVHAEQSNSTVIPKMLNLSENTFWNIVPTQKRLILLHKSRI
jgi:hypothetical protein